MKLPIGDKLIVTNSVNCECICVGGITDVWRCPHIIAFLNSAIQDRFIMSSLNVLQICCRRATFGTGLIIIVVNRGITHAASHFWCLFDTRVFNSTALFRN